MKNLEIPLRVQVSKGKNMKLNRLSMFGFKNGKQSNNRVVVPPMASQTADKNGFVTEKTVGYYEELSKSRAGIIFVEYSFVHQTGKGELNQLGANDDNQIVGLSKLVNVIKKTGSLAGLQIVHNGAKSDSNITGSVLLAPSSLSVPVKGQQLEKPIEMTYQQIVQYENWYLKAVERAYLAGFDIVELHAAHGYGINQWLSPLTNQRSDEFGGSVFNRIKLLLNIVKRIKREFPSLLLAVRMPGQDYIKGGLELRDMIFLAKELDSNGVDILDISSGIGGWRRPRNRIGQGYLVEDASIIKKHVSIPVIGVGGIQEGEFIDEVLQEKKVDFTAVGRAILSGPSEWYVENIERRKGSCIAC